MHLIDRDSPVDESPLGVHKIELVVESGPGLGNGGGVGQHADSSGYLSEVPTRHHSWGLVVDANLIVKVLPFIYVNYVH